MSLSKLQSRLDATLPDGYIEAVSVPGYQAINLALINGDFPIGPLPNAVMNAVIKDPAYWTFFWGSGIALALPTSIGLYPRNLHFRRCAV